MVVFCCSSYVGVTASWWCCDGLVVVVCEVGAMVSRECFDVVVVVCIMFVCAMLSKCCCYDGVVLMLVLLSWCWWWDGDGFVKLRLL